MWSDDFSQYYISNWETGPSCWFTSLEEAKVVVINLLEQVLGEELKGIDKEKEKIDKKYKELSNLNNYLNKYK